MGVYEDYFKNHGVIPAQTIAKLRKKAIETGSSIALNDPAVDYQWARTSTGKELNSSYFEYYFSGQDIKVNVAEIDDPKFTDLPIIDFAFNIEQEKLPVYGFWSYTYDAIARGVRIVTGAFSIATRYPNYMADLLAEAAAARSRKNGGLEDYGRPLTDDDVNIDQYWGRSMDPVLNKTGANIFSIHPPFTFVVNYGIQSMSVENTSVYENYYGNFRQSSEYVTDANHRLVSADSDRVSFKLYIDAVELKNVQRQFSSTGEVCTEVYTFIARDVIVPPPTSNPSPQLGRVVAAQQPSDGRRFIDDVGNLVNPQ